MQSSKNKSDFILFLLLLGFLLIQSPFGAPIEAFGETYNYPCDESFFQKGEGLFSFKKSDGVDLKARMFFPDDWSEDDKRPAILIFFGGGWSGRCGMQLKWFWEYYSSEGFVVMIPDYRLGGPIENLAIPDGKAAVRWMRSHADSLGVDSDKIITMGSSAGGHQAAAMGTVKGYEHESEDLDISSIPNAMVPMWPVLDLTRHFGNMTNNAQKTSPSHTIDDDTPPILILSGERDQYNSGHDSYMNNAKKFDCDATRKIFPGKGHDFGLRPESNFAEGHAGEDSVISWSMSFFERLELLPSQAVETIPPGNTRFNSSSNGPVVHFNTRHPTAVYFRTSRYRVDIRGRRHQLRMCDRPFIETK